ncbi:hypothetical protein ACFX2I_022982 [Malus domestica]
MVVVFYSNTSSINLNKGIEGSSSASKFIPNSLAAPGKATRINNPPATNPPPQVPSDVFAMTGPERQGGSDGCRC